MKQQSLFICQHCNHELAMPRAGMSLREAKSWFKYARCPACKHALRVRVRVLAPVVPTYTQPQLWGGEPGEGGTPKDNVQRSGVASSASAATGADCRAIP